MIVNNCDYRLLTSKIIESYTRKSAEYGFRNIFSLYLTELRGEKLIVFCCACNEEKATPVISEAVKKKSRKNCFMLRYSIIRRVNILSIF